MSNDVTSYEAMCKAVISAVDISVKAANKWETMGPLVKGFYGTEIAIKEVKAQFLADAIIPALPAKHQKALETDLVRKGSKEYNQLDDHGRALWETANDAKVDARSTAHTMFSRVVSYAFPAEKKESVPTPTATKLVELINDAIKKAQKDQAPTYDVTSLVAHLTSALSIVK
jgi:hypothetical protein